MSKATALLFGVVLLDLIGFGIIIPILPFLSPQLGADKLDIAYIIVVYAAFSGLFGPFWGRLSDRIGRKPVIMICLAGAALSYLMLAFATSLWMIYLARGFAGLMAGNFGVASAMMADITQPQNRAKGMGLIGAAFGLGLLLGPLLGGLLSGDSASFFIPCITAAVMSVLAIVAAALFLPESLPVRDPAARDEAATPASLSLYAMLRVTGNRLLACQYVLHNTVVSGITYLFPLWVADRLAWGAKEVGLVFGVQGAIMVMVQGGLMGVLVRSLGEWNLLRASVSFFLSGLLVAVFASTMPAMLAAVFIAMTGATLCMPLLNTITTVRTPANLRGRMMGTTSAASSWGRVLGPLIAGSMLSLSGFSAAWAVCAAVVFCYLIWAFTAQSSLSDQASQLGDTL